MKNKKRMLSLLLAGMLCAAIACAAFAEGKLLTIWNAGSKLLFETGNVTLTGRADFSYDGNLFKSFNGTYVQDGADSYMQAMFDTPRVDGTVYTGGYTVIANDGQAYSIDTNMPYFYRQNSASLNESILTNTVIRSSLLRFGGLLLDLMEDRMANAITQTDTENGTDYQIRLQPGEAPEAMSAAMTVLMQLLGKEYLYIDPQDFADQLTNRQTARLDILYEDWEALFARKYKEAYGEDLPENYYNLYWDEEGNSTPLRDRCLVISDEIDALRKQLHEQYDTGIVSVGVDSSVTYFETMHDAMIANDQYNVRYEDPDWAFRRYYEKVTGTPLSQQELELILRLGNEELSQAYTAMVRQMREEYAAIARENGASTIFVWNDGSFALSKGTAEESALFNLMGMTPARRILYSLESADVDSTDVTVRLDKEGRLTRVAGTITLITHDLLGQDHTLSMTFDFGADNYGSSIVKAFNPEDYNVISAQEFYGSDSINDWSLTLKTDLGMEELPEVIVFNGVEYPLPVDDGSGNG